MAKEMGRPGDTIKIIDGGEKFLNRDFIVIEIPDEAAKMGVGVREGDAWFSYEQNEFYSRMGCYVVIIRPSGTSKVLGTKNVDTFLKKQRDDNLNSIFG